MTFAAERVARLYSDAAETAAGGKPRQETCGQAIAMKLGA
jgi:hypothetical protein